MSYNVRKNKLKELIGKYKLLDHNDMTEETVRGWINEMLNIFGWNTNDTSQVLQEKTLSPSEKEKLGEIDSKYSRPDYTFILGANKITFLDAKNITINLKTNKDSAFQIKSYGWSIGAPCAFITNFEEFVIYDTTYVPNKDQNTNLGSMYIGIDEYIDKFDILNDHLLKNNIIKGILSDKYSNGVIQGIEKISLDDKFSTILSSFRLKLAKNIYKKNKNITEYDINLYVQIILNRILFIRVCESKGLEKEGLLNDFKSKGFWNSFKKSSYLAFFDKYDGPIFSHDNIKNINISDNIFEDFLIDLYYPSPYKFNVIPTHILSDIYELFLGKKLEIKDNEIIETDNSLYEKSNGVVITPKYIVESLTKKTINKQIIDSLSIDELLDLKIVDISCGSGVFLIEAYIILEESFIYKYSKVQSYKYEKYFIEKDDKFYINQEGKRLIFNNCIFGVDINPESVEVTKMSLCLKVIDSLDLDELTYLEITKGDQILNGLGNNIKVGNSLVSDDILEKNKEILNNKEELSRINFFNWDGDKGFKDIFDKKGGFDFIIGNPPYVEAKNYNSSLKIMHKYLKKEFYSFSGKADLLIAFIEKSIQLLNGKGKMGYVIQDRFFKTENGKNIRKIITKNNLLNSIISFKSNDLFKGRDTYISYLILSKSFNDTLFFKKIDGEESYLKNNLLNILSKDDYMEFEQKSFDDGPWILDNAELLKLKNVLVNKYGTLGDGIYKIGVGLQVLWNDAYHIEVESIKDNIIYGKTKLSGNSIIQFELKSCTKIIENIEKKPFQKTDFDKYVIFPFRINDGNREAILWNEFSKLYPKTASYLNKSKVEIIKNVQVFGIDGNKTKKIEESDGDKWHIYTRTSNIEFNIRKKIAIPMTLKYTTAIFMQENVYCDNSNVTFLDINEDNEELLYALAGIVNSNIFSSFGELIAIKQLGGYYKFNKQYLSKIPFPKDNFFGNKDNLVNYLYNSVKNIINYQELYLRGKPEHIRVVLQKEWIILNNFVLDLYEIKNLATRTLFLNELDINNRIN